MTYRKSKTPLYKSRSRSAVAADSEETTNKSLLKIRRRAAVRSTSRQATIARRRVLPTLFRPSSFQIIAKMRAFSLSTNTPQDAGVAKWGNYVIALSCLLRPGAKNCVNCTSVRIIVRNSGHYFLKAIRHLWSNYSFNESRKYLASIWTPSRESVKFAYVQPRVANISPPLSPTHKCSQRFPISNR